MADEQGVTRNLVLGAIEVAHHRQLGVAEVRHDYAIGQAEARHAGER